MSFLSQPATVTPALSAGLADPVFDSQAVFRAALDALCYAGRIQDFAVDLDPPAPIEPAAAAIALTLFDFETPVWLDEATAAGDVASYLRFHCGASIVADAADARFALISNPAGMPALEAFAFGEDRYPELSATLIVAVPSLVSGPRRRWTGPGINGALDVAVAGLPDDFWRQWADNQVLYPMGLDVIFTCGHQAIGLPRTIRVED
jgi:alpha-D-ribose 1-methylphosphonate 5-triphosphate synthase subunit PhnH